MTYQRARIRLERSGGFAGLVTTHTVDTDQLDPRRRADYLELLDRLDLDAPAGRPSRSDQFQYDLALDLDGDRRRLRYAEAGQTPDLKSLTGMIAADSAPKPPIRSG